MAKPLINQRTVKGSALTFTEFDTSLVNLRDSTISIAVAGSDTVVNDLNDVTTFTATDGIVITATASSQSIEFNAALVQDTTPQLGGDLDVNGHSIVSQSDGNISITPDGAGYIVLSGQNWPQADGLSGEFLTTDGLGSLSWTADTNTTYTLSAEQTSTGDAFIQLLGSDATTDSVEIAAGPGIAVERVDANRIEIRQTFPTWDSLGSLTWDDIG